jgi:hypothetical protein
MVIIFFSSTWNNEIYTRKFFFLHIYFEKT